MNLKIIVLSLTAGILLFAGYLASFKYFKTAPQQIACIGDAKLCPDGSYVGRTGPNCEFAVCPNFGTSDVQKFDVSGWQTYRNEEYGFEFKYPEKLKLSKTGNEVIISHAIPYENYGDCDMSGGEEVFDTLTDFRVSFEVLDGKKQFDFTDGEYKRGILNGNWVYHGPEGCGYIEYRFYTKFGDTLVVKENAVQALSGISSIKVKDEILKIPGVISAEENDEIFDQILSTFKFLK